MPIAIVIQYLIRRLQIIFIPEHFLINTNTHELLKINYAISICIANFNDHLRVHVLGKRQIRIQQHDHFLSGNCAAAVFIDNIKLLLYLLQFIE